MRRQAQEKTAVLVERIIRKIVLGETSIERLLIVTFARDAASQMQSRLKKALVKCMNSSYDDVFKARIRKELRLLNHSDITTIDSFCIGVVRKNFHLLGIDPGFKIIAADEADVLLMETLDEFLDSLYEANDERIIKLSDCYSDGFNDYGLKNIMSTLFKFTRSLPETKVWIKNNAEKYKDIKNSDWYLEINEKINEKAKELKELILCAVNCMMMHAIGEVKEISELNADEAEILDGYDNKGLWACIKKAAMATEAMDITSRDSILEAVLAYGPFNKQSMGGANKEERKEVIDRYNEAFNAGKELSELCEGGDEISVSMYEEGIYPELSLLAEVVCEFEDFYFEKKRKKNNFEFNDLEHLCYRLLKDFPEVREEYNKKYDEILMDEYQDTNELQDTIFDLILDKKFMVGDMKQSIYRFRNSDPFIFKDKDKRYSENEKEGRRIILSENFRSRPQVLTSINEIFRRIMSENAGEVTYDETQELHWGNTSYKGENDEKFLSELYIVEGKGEEGEEENLSNTEIEARFVAKKIRSMIDEGFMVSDGKNMRPVTAGDFVIIQNAVKQTGEIFITELKKAGLDAYAENEGYFERSEIKLMMALLDILNNPLQDIPLVAVMRSILFGFSEDELALIRICKKGDFFDAVFKMSKDDSDCGKKCRAFCEKLSKWRNYAKYMSSDRLIWTIFEETDFYDLMGVLYDGEETRDNLRLLFERARQFEKTGFKGLSSFIDYMKKMETNSKMASAGVVSDNKNVVRIMTIHKSKGLEFPVCIFAGLGKHFNAVKGEKIMLHKDLGIGIDFVDPENGYYVHTAVQNIIKKAKLSEERAETLRKLYVGMTRAKEKLILVATINSTTYDKKGNLKSGFIYEKQKWNTYYNPELGVMKPETVLSVSRYIDLIAPIVLAHKNECGWINSVIEFNETPEVEEKSTQAFEETQIDEELIDKLLGSDYKASEREYIPGKISVTEIEKLNREKSTDDDISDAKLEDKHSEKLSIRRDNLKRPSFLQSGGLTGAERGTAYHTVLALIDAKADLSLDGISKQMQEMEAKGFLSPEARECVEASDIKEFFESDIGSRLKNSTRVFKEEPFEILVSSREALKTEEEREILIQGVIDLMFEEDGKLILVDYKTDKGLSEKELMNHYSGQLMWYKEAAEKLMDMTVSEVFLYSIDKHKEIKIL